MREILYGSADEAVMRSLARGRASERGSCGWTVQFVTEGRCEKYYTVAYDFE